MSALYERLADIRERVAPTADDWRDHYIGWRMRDLWDYVGGLSQPSKMPGYGYSLPAAECRVGSKLGPLPDSTCHYCYAQRGRYVFPNVQRAMYRRLECIDKPYWAEAMAELLLRKQANSRGVKDLDVFRWHDSGDIQSAQHMRAIVRVAELTPSVRHWIPTREYREVTSYLKAGGRVPENLNVRMSAHMVGGRVPSFKGLPLTVSTVRRDEPPAGTHQCPARQQQNACGSCRACWNRNIAVVNYPLH